MIQRNKNCGLKLKLRQCLKSETVMVIVSEAEPTSKSSTVRTSKSTAMETSKSTAMETTNSSAVRSSTEVSSSTTEGELFYKESLEAKQKLNFQQLNRQRNNSFLEKA